MSNYSNDPNISTGVALLEKTNKGQINMSQAITTRVLQKRLEKIYLEEWNPGERRKSKFLSGTQLPNSTAIRSNLNKEERRDTMSQKTEYCESNHDVAKEGNPESELYTRKLAQERAMEMMKKKFRSVDQDESVEIKNVDLDEEKQRRRISRRTLDLASNQRRRSTFEDLKKAIKNSKPTEGLRLVNVNSIDIAINNERAMQKRVSFVDSTELSVKN